MAYQLWSQDIFSKGELSPYMYGRVTVNEYNNGLKQAKNVLTYPTGAAGKRFGTIYQSTLNAAIQEYNQFFFETFVYLDSCIFQLVFRALAIDVYIEGQFLLTIVTTLDAQSVYNLTTTVLGPIFRISGQGFRPQDLVPGYSGAILITGISANAFTFAVPVATGYVIPIQFNAAGALPVTKPQIKKGLIYYTYGNTSTSVTIYLTASDAKYQTNAIQLISYAAGLQSMYFLNNWSYGPTSFQNVPVYDFNGNTTSYDAITFTPSALTGTSVNIHLSSPYVPLTTAYIGGAFIGGGGRARITDTPDHSNITVSVQEPFDALTAIQGSLAVLAEPAWSDLRGWPQICSSYQNRALFANTQSLPNGFYASVINDYYDFGDLTNDPDDAISWYPSSNNVNVIRFIVPYRSITVHTNTGIYSSPLSDVAAITPTNFTLQLQDSTPASVLQPQAIDNQVLVISGNDAHQMLWDGINNAYTSDIVSVISEQTIRDPIDEVAYADLYRAGSRYVFIINKLGSMAVFQTLISQNVSGFTSQVMEQSYGDASFTQAASSPDGRCWFVVKRHVADSATGVLKTISFDSLPTTSVKATASAFNLTDPLAITFTTTGSLPTSTPQINTSTYYWAIGIDADHFHVYTSQDDARAGVNAINFTAAGSNSKVQSWPVIVIFTMEELTQETFLDCAVYFNNHGAPSANIAVPQLFNAQDVKMIGDGYGFEATGFGNQVNFSAHGVATPVDEGYIGFPIHTVIEPMPLSIANGPSAKNSSLTKPNHIRTARFMFNNTIGGTINGVDIALNPLADAHIGMPPFPQRGYMELSIMKGWEDFNNPSFTIEHSEPFNIELLGVYYSVDI